MITSRYVNFLPDKSISLFMQPEVLIINGLHQAISFNLMDAVMCVTFRIKICAG